MSVQKLVGCGVVTAVLLPLGIALFVVVSVLAFIQSLPGADLAAAAMDHFVGRQRQISTVEWPYGERHPGEDSADLQPYEADIQATSSRYGVDVHLVRAVILQESGGNPRATSPVGAAGLMQVMPATFADLGYDPARIYEPRLNIEAGVRYLSRSLAAFGGDVYWTAAAYNAGIAGAKWLKETYGFVPASFAGGETLRYVTAVTALIGER